MCVCVKNIEMFKVGKGNFLFKIISRINLLFQLCEHVHMSIENTLFDTYVTSGQLV